MPKLQSVLQDASHKLSAISISSRLDAEVLLAHVLKVDRCYLYSHPEIILDQNILKHFEEDLTRRLNGEPIAYILGYREFWSLNLKINDAVLIPRPETELLVEIALNLLADHKNDDIHVADLGTGSGAIALALAHERPCWNIEATDKSIAALDVAKNNANRLQINNVRFFSGDWCDALPLKKYAAIISNPPYVAVDDEYLQQGNVRFEPKTALISGADGLNDLRTIISQARAKLQSCGFLIVEHGYNQQEAVKQIFEQNQYCQIKGYNDFSNIPRAVCGFA